MPNTHTPHAWQWTQSVFSVKSNMHTVHIRILLRISLFFSFSLFAPYGPSEGAVRTIRTANSFLHVVIVWKPLLRNSILRHRRMYDTSELEKVLSLISLCRIKQKIKMIPPSPFSSLLSSLSSYLSGVTAHFGLEFFSLK
jgi:hypothetical protein